MLVHLLRWLGVTPDRAGKTGKREAAWMVTAITLALTVYAMALGERMVDAMTPVLMVLWPSSLALLGAAYKLEYDKARVITGDGAQPPGWPADIVPPEQAPVAPEGAAG